MITGVRLAENLSFHRSVVQNEILRMSARLLELDRKLNLMRIEEAVAWRRYASSGSDASTGDQASGSVREILDRRHLKANTAIETIEEAEVELAAIQKPRESAALALERARETFEKEEARIRQEMASDPGTARNRTEAEALARHEKRIAKWMVEAPAVIEPMIQTFETDVAFMYLHRRGYGTESYRGAGLARILDRWLARKCSFEEAEESYRTALGYEDAARGWQRECEERGAMLKAEAEGLRTALMAPLDSPRRKLAEALNALDGIDERADHLKIRRSMAMGEVLKVVLGRDSEYQSMVDTFVRLLAKERAAAMIRIAASPEEGPDAVTTAEIDRIVSERIGLSMEADGYRRHISGAEARVRAVETVASKLAMRQWDNRKTAFSIEERTLLCHDLGNGRVTADEAWQEIENAHDEAPAVSAAAA